LSLPYQKKTSTIEDTPRIYGKNPEYLESPKTLEDDVLAEVPSDLIETDFLDLQALCRESNVSVVARNKFELIGRLLTAFSPESLTDQEMDKFSLEQLQHMCSGAYLSSRGTKLDLITRLMKYGRKDINLPTPYKTEDFPTRKSKKGKVPVLDTISTIEASSRKRRASSSLENKNIKKQKIPFPNFTDIAPTIPITIENKWYEAEPKSNGVEFGWTKEGIQKVIMAGMDLNVAWKLDMVVEGVVEEAKEDEGEREEDDRDGDEVDYREDGLIVNEK